MIHRTLASTRPRFAVWYAFVFVASTAGLAMAQAPYVDAQGRSWRQLPDSVGRTWDSFAAVCPTDGVTPCTGSTSGLDLTGYVWATQTQTLELFSEFLPEVADELALGGAAYTLPALGFFGSFKPTWEFYTTFGGYNYLSGWTATNSGGFAIVPEASAQYPVFNGSFSLLTEIATSSASFYRGAWLFLPAPGPFENLGGSLPGSWGAPGLKGTSTLAPGSTTTLDIAHGNPNSIALLAIGASAVNLPLYGGVFVPSPDLLISGLPIDANGALSLAAPWPSNVPSGVSLYFQAWMPDVEGPLGFAATNALRLVTP